MLNILGANGCPAGRVASLARITISTRSWLRKVYLENIKSAFYHNVGDNQMGIVKNIQRAERPQRAAHQVAGPQAAPSSRPRTFESY